MFFSNKIEHFPFCAAAICLLSATSFLLSTTHELNAQNVPLGQELLALPEEPITVEPLARTRPTSFADDIGATTLAAPSQDAIGLAASRSLGLGPAMWGDTSGDQALVRVRAVEPSRYASVNKLVRRALIASAPPPQEVEGLLAARAEALMRFGAAEEAASLATSVGSESDPRLAKVAASAALVVGRDEQLCNADAIQREADPRFWDTVRAYCLATSEDPLAGAAIGAISELGSLEADDILLLESMLDETLAELVTLPSAEQLDAPRIAMLRRLGRASSIVEFAPLPMIAGLFSLESTGARGALVAAEKLEAAGAIETETLRSLYISLADELDDSTELGVRARLTQAAFDDPDADAIGEALLSASSSQQIGGFAQLARILAPAAAKLPDSAARGRGATGYAIRDALLIGGFADEAAQWTEMQALTSPIETADAQALLAIADPNWDGSWQRSWGDTLRERAGNGDEHARRVLGALAGFSIAPRPRIDNEPLLETAEAGRIAETVLALAPFVAGEPSISARRLDIVIRSLRASGLTDDARLIALEAMVSARWR